LIARRNVTLVYGGGRVGLMGELADATLAHGGRVIGVIPAGLFAQEVNHTGLTELREVTTMHERKQLMYDLSDAFVALPGGLGTLEELAEVATWSQLGLHSKPVVLLNVGGFWDALLTQLDLMARTGLLSPASRDLIRQARSAKEALSVLTAAAPAQPEKWMTAEER
jgi:uncharacterized protein (TIGR00730 family)